MANAARVLTRNTNTVVRTRKSVFFAVHQTMANVARAHPKSISMAAEAKSASIVDQPTLAIAAKAHMASTKNNRT